MVRGRVVMLRCYEVPMKLEERPGGHGKKFRFQPRSHDYMQILNISEPPTDIKHI